MTSTPLRKARERKVLHFTGWGLQEQGPTSRKPRESKNLLMKEMMRVRVSKMPRTLLFMIKSRYRCRYLVSCSSQRRFSVASGHRRVSFGTKVGRMANAPRNRSTRNLHR